MDKELKIIPPEGYKIDEKNSTSECIRFKSIENPLPTTWEEFCKTHPVKPGECYIGSGVYSNITKINYENIRKALPMTMLPSLEDAKAMIALCQLIQLRDCYNQGWKPKWNDHTTKYTIVPVGACSVEILSFYITPRVLSFQNREVCEEFYKNFRDLLKVARPLL